MRKVAVLTCAVAATLIAASAQGQQPLESGYYSGRVVLGGSKYLCVLSDANANEKFDDANADIRLSDRIRLDDGDNVFIGRAGKYFQAAGKLYHLEVWPFGDPRLVGANGEQITFSRNGRQPPPPKIRISNADNSFSRSYTFEYG